MHATTFAASLIEGVSGDDPEGGAGSGVLRRRLVTVRPGRQGPRPPGTTTWVRGARCTDPEGKCPPLYGGGRRRRRKRGPGSPKPPRWSAERRASRVMGRKAPRKRLVRRVTACRTGVPPSTRTFLGAPPTPRFGVSEAKSQTPGAENAPRERVDAGTSRSGLFDIVRWELPQTVRRRAANSAAVVAPSPTELGLARVRQPSSLPGLTRQSIRFEKTFFDGCAGHKRVHARLRR